MLDLFKRDERVVTTRGYLFGLQSIGVMLAGAGLGSSPERLFQWAGLALVVLGLMGMVFCYSHLWTAPQPLEQDRPATD